MYVLVSITNTSHLRSLIKTHYPLTFKKSTQLITIATKRIAFRMEKPSPKKPSLILHRRRNRFRCRRKFTPLSDLGAVFPKNNWNGDEDQSNEAEEGTSPIDTEGVEHVHAEEGEDGSGEGSEEGVCCYC